MAEENRTVVCPECGYPCREEEIEDLGMCFSCWYEKNEDTPLPETV